MTYIILMMVSGIALGFTLTMHTHTTDKALAAIRNTSDMLSETVTDTELRLYEAILADFYRVPYLTKSSYEDALYALKLSNGAIEFTRLAKLYECLNLIVDNKHSYISGLHGYATSVKTEVMYIVYPLYRTRKPQSEYNYFDLNFKDKLEKFVKHVISYRQEETTK